VDSCTRLGLGEGDVRPLDPAELVEEERGDGGNNCDSADDDDEADEAETARAGDGLAPSGKR
jgi:hypothetical protein